MVSEQPEGVLSRRVQWSRGVLVLVEGWRVRRLLEAAGGLWGPRGWFGRFGGLGLRLPGTWFVSVSAFASDCWMLYLLS